MNKQNVLTIHTDGGSRGNPGPAAIGAVVEGNGKELVGIGQRIGITTNNVAEYSALLAALTWVIEHKETLTDYTHIAVMMDSELLVSQLNGIYKIRDAKLRSLLFAIREKEATLTIPLTYTHVPRGQNKRADQLVNLALDNKI